MYIVDKQEKCYNYKQGYITLVSVLVLGSVGIAIAVSLIFLGLGYSRSSFSLENSQEAKAMANACAEEGLRQIQANTSYTGNGNITIGSNTCSYTVTNTGGETRGITSISTVNNVTRRVSISINALTPKLSIGQWQEVAN